ncbi:MAG: hypothetical protein RIF33_24075 [Cyclobacteriaceae bacterium]
MKKLLILPILFCGLGLSAQQTAFVETNPNPAKIIKETIALEGSTAITLEFPYATDIRLTNAPGSEIEVYVNASINNGENNEAYELLIEKEGDQILLGTDRARLDSFFKKNSGRQNNCYSTDIMVEVSIPSGMLVFVESISGSVTGELRDKPYTIKTISGDIGLSVPSGIGAEVIASTISGAMYADITLDFLDGKEGLNQIVGEKIHANINKGGELHRLETISGDVLLRSRK